MRIRFSKGKQRKFIDEVLKETNCPSLRSLTERILINYSTLKSYYNENRLIPENLFKDMCFLAKLNIKHSDVEVLDENWGRVKGGRN